MPYLAINIYSNDGLTQHGKAKDVVEIVADYGTVKIVVNTMGKRFSVKAENLIEDESKADGSNKPPETHATKPKSQGKKQKASPVTQTLF